MDKKKLVIIFPTFEQLETVKKTLPSILEEVQRHANCQLIVYDCSIKNKQEKWNYLESLKDKYNFFLVMSDNTSMAHVRNISLNIALEMFYPDYVGMLEDDHGFKPGFIEKMLSAMQTYYGEICENGLRFGLFTGCTDHAKSSNRSYIQNHSYVNYNDRQVAISGANSCCRFAPTQHWQNVIKGYDTDEYLISTYQTRGVNIRNYNKGFCALYVDDGNSMFSVDCTGRGVTSTGLKLWDSDYCASDPRSHFLGKPNRIELLWEKAALLCKDKKVAIYGTGKFSEKLFSNQSLFSKANIIAFLDDSPRSNNFYSFPVIHPQSFDFSSIDSIVLSTDTYQLQMKARIKNYIDEKQIITLSP